MRDGGIGVGQLIGIGVGRDSDRDCAAMGVPIEELVMLVIPMLLGSVHAHRLAIHSARVVIEKLIGLHLPASFFICTPQAINLLLSLF